MMTIEQLNEIREAKRELVMVRKLIKEEGEKLAEKTGYRKQVLICGGTGCTSSGSHKVVDTLEASLKKHGLEDEILVVKTGCFGLCALGPIMIVYPEGCFYSQMTPEHVERIVEEHLRDGNVVKEYLYQETVHSDGSILSLNETNFYKKQMRVALRNCGVIDPEQIEEYIAVDGYQALAKAVTQMTGDEVIDEVLKSGLRGGRRRTQAEVPMAIKDDVLRKLLGAEGVLSGSALADSLHVSRSAMWKAIEQLRSEGYNIEAATNRGYRLAAGPEALTVSKT